MMDTMTSNFGPSQTPQVIRRLIIWTCIISILSALTNNLFVQVFHITGPQELLTLSLYGLKNFYLWQPITYLFTHEASAYGINIFFLLSLFFEMYVLWVVGSMVHERIGTMRFLTVYFLSGIIAGLLALLVIYLSGHYIVLAGPSAALLALFTLWTMFYPDNIIMLFFLIPMKTVWLFVGVLGIIILTSLSSLDLVGFIFYFSGVLFGYLYGLLALGLKSPFEFTQSFDRKVIQLMDRIRGGAVDSSKVVDISTDAEYVSDEDAFVDAMLTKISKHGEKSLSTSEKQRMKKISERKMRDRKR